MEIHSQASTILQIRTSHTLYAYTFVRVCGIEKVYLSNIHVLCVYFVSKASHFGWTGCFYCVIKYLPHKFKIKVIMYVTHTHTPYAEKFKHVRSQSTKFSLCSFGSFFFVGNLNAFGAERRKAAQCFGNMISCCFIDHHHHHQKIIHIDRYPGCCLCASSLISTKRLIPTKNKSLPSRFQIVFTVYRLIIISTETGILTYMQRTKRTKNNIRFV